MPARRVGDPWVGASSGAWIGGCTISMEKSPSPSIIGATRLAATFPVSTNLGKMGSMRAIKPPVFVKRGKIACEDGLHPSIIALVPRRSRSILLRDPSPCQGPPPAVEPSQPRATILYPDAGGRRHYRVASTESSQDLRVTSMWTFIWCLTTIFGSHDGKEPTDRLIPPGWQGQSVGTGGDACAQDGGTPADPDDAVDEAVGRSGARPCSATATSSSAAATPSSCSATSRSAGSSPAPATAASRTPGSWPSRTASRSSTTPRRPACGGSRSSSGSSTTPGRSASSGSGRSDRPYAAEGGRATAATLFERQVPFDYDLGARRPGVLLRRDDREGVSLRRLPLSEPVRLGDMENIVAVSDLRLRLPEDLEPDTRPARVLPGQRASRDLVVARAW